MHTSLVFLLNFDGQTCRGRLRLLYLAQTFRFGHTHLAEFVTGKIDNHQLAIYLLDQIVIVRT